MDPMSAPGFDGFTGKFFRHCWELVGSNVVDVVQHFYQIGTISPGLNSNFIVLIPKVDNALMTDQYRPIVLGNFLFKVITKILADCLGSICFGTISPN